MNVKNILKAPFQAFQGKRSGSRSQSILAQPKYKAEIYFWREVLKRYVEWYRGEIPSLYGEPSPGLEKRTGYDINSSAILTWLDVHQKTKYVEDLLLSRNAFRNEKVLDIGSGPIPSALVFDDCKVYCLDPLHPLYMDAGFPIHIYEDRAKFVFGFSETMPFADDFFDTVISVNALDHVDDFFATAREIKRVLKPQGKIRFHLHYHDKTPTEPLELNDEIVSDAFSWSPSFRKISESKEKRGTILDSVNESYTVWSNF